MTVEALPSSQLLLGSIHQGAGNEHDKFKFMNRISQIITEQAQHQARAGDDQSLYLLLINYSEAGWVLSAVSLGAPVSALTWEQHTSPHLTSPPHSHLIILTNDNGRWWWMWFTSSASHGVDRTER